MVYCTKCGTKNPDDATVCLKCGKSLHMIGDREYYRRVEKECFGIPRGNTIFVLAIGLIVLLWGCIMILQQANVLPKGLDVWPFALVIFGVLLLIGAMYALSRRS